MKGNLTPCALKGRVIDELTKWANNHPGTISEKIITSGTDANTISQLKAGGLAVHLSLERALTIYLRIAKVETFTIDELPESLGWNAPATPQQKVKHIEAKRQAAMAVAFGVKYQR